MLKSLFLKTLHSLRWQTLGWSIGITFIVFVTVSLFDSFSQSGFEEIVTSVPESLRGFLGNADNYTSVPGYLAQQVFGLKVAMFAIVMSILLFISISASEEDDGRLQTLLTLPLTRTKIYFQKWAAGILCVGIVLAFLLAAVYVGLAVIGKDVDAMRVFESLGAMWLTCCTFGMVGFGVAMLTGKKGLTVALASGYAIFCIVMNSLAASIDQLKDWDKISLLHYYNNPQIMQHGLDWNHMYILGAAFIVLTLLGWIGFTKRSINT
jgi:ABC-2 type transport system permease protein